MSLDDLTTHRTTEPTTSSSPQKRTRSLAWMLPVGLILGFLVVLALLFGKRLLPAIPVKTAPVITIRAGEELKASTSPTQPQKTTATTKGALLFQASGWVEPDPYTVFITSLVNGVVDKVHVLEGQTVKQGQLLATLIDDDAKLNLLTAQQKHIAYEKMIHAHCTEYNIIDSEIIAAQSKINSMQALLNQARDSSDRLTRLKKGTISELEVTKAKLTTESQAAILAEAQAEIPRLKAKKVQIEAQQLTMDANLQELTTARDRAQLALDRTQIKSTMDGIVLHLHAAPGVKRMLDMDSPTSAVIVELYDPNKLQARIDVPLNEAAALSAGQTVELVSDLLPDRTFTGQVTRISGQADLQRNTLQAKVQITNPDPRLRPDMLVRAKFFSAGESHTSGTTSTSSNTRLSIYVPENALVNDTTVWVVTTDNTAEKRTIKLGTQTKDNHRLVLDGLRSGESVILPPHDKLTPAARLTITN
ncbi:MAG: efflux RND transporter periplasmic adaptor subunit [Akkermansiaceae bacterium]